MISIDSKLKFYPASASTSDKLTDSTRSRKFYFWKVSIKSYKKSLKYFSTHAMLQISSHSIKLYVVLPGHSSLGHLILLSRVCAAAAPKSRYGCNKCLPLWQQIFNSLLDNDVCCSVEPRKERASFSSYNDFKLLFLDIIRLRLLRHP